MSRYTVVAGINDQTIVNFDNLSDAIHTFASFTSHREFVMITLYKHRLFGGHKVIARMYGPDKRCVQIEELVGPAPQSPGIATALHKVK